MSTLPSPSAIAVCAALPGAALAVVGLPLVVAWIYYLLLSIGGWRLAPLLRRWSAALHAQQTHARISRSGVIARLVIALLGAGGAAAPALTAGEAAHLDFLDVGPGGAATLLRLP